METSYEGLSCYVQMGEGFPQEDPTVPRFPADTWKFSSKHFPIHWKSISYQFDPDISCVSYLEMTPLF